MCNMCRNLEAYKIYCHYSMANRAVIFSEDKAMIRIPHTRIALWFVLALSLLLQSCGGGESGPSAGTGTLSIGLTDAANGDYQAVYVTIAEVQVKKQGEGESEGEVGWETFAAVDKTYNLLDLMNGVIAPLGVGELEAGQYGQMRLILGELPEAPEENILGEQHPFANYLIKVGEGSNEGLTEELKVPSGYQTGIKLVRGFTIVASGGTELILDFDAHRSIVKAGNSGKWLLKPTIKVLEANSVSGTVVDNSETSNPLGGALVSAQIFEPGAEDLKDEVIVESTTVTTDAGAYKFFLLPDIYNIVATMDDYLPACQKVEALYYEELLDINFILVPRDTETDITISGTVSGLATDEVALLSIRQTTDCGLWRCNDRSSFRKCCKWR